MSASKVCQSCKQELGAECFSKCSRNHLKLRSACKSCRTKAERVRYQIKAPLGLIKRATPEMASIHHKNYYLRNKEKVAAAVKVWQSNNAECVARSNKKWRSKNREQYLEIHRIYREKNKERFSGRNKRFAADLSDRYIAHLIGHPLGILPQPLIQMYRVHVQIKRQLKEMK